MRAFYKTIEIFITISVYFFTTIYSHANPNEDNSTTISSRSITRSDRHTLKPISENHRENHSPVLQAKYPMQITDVCYSHNGSVLAIAQGYIITLHDNISGKLTKTLHGYGDLINTIAFHPTDLQIIGGSVDNKVLVWDAIHGEVIKCYDFSSVFDDGPGITFSTFFDHGKKILAISNDSKAAIKSVGSNGKIHVLNLDSNVTAASASPDSLKIIFGLDNGKAVLFQNDKEELSMKLDVGRGPITSVAFCPERDIVATGLFDGCILLWDSQNGSKLTKLDGLGSHLNQVCTSRAKNSSLHTIRIIRKAFLRDICFSVDGNQLVAGSHGGDIWIWSIPSGKDILACNRKASQWNNTEGLQAIVMEPKTNRFLVASDFNVQSRQPNGKPNTVFFQDKPTLDRIGRVTISPMNDSMAVFVVDKELNTRPVIWNLEKGHPIKHLSWEESCGVIADATYGNTGHNLLAHGVDNPIICWDVKNGYKRTLFESKELFSPETLATDLHDSRILSVCALKKLVAWSPGDLPDVQVFDKSKANYKTSATLNSTGEYLLIAENNTISRVCSKTGKPCGNIKLGESPIQTLCPCDINSCILAGTKDGHIWHLSQSLHNQPKVLLRADEGIVRIVAKSGHGHFAAQTSSGKILVRGLNNEKTRVTIPPGSFERIPENNRITTIEFSADGSKLIVGICCTLHVWDLKTTKECLRFNFLDGADKWIAFTPDGRYDGSSDIEKHLAWNHGNKLLPERIQSLKSYKTPGLVGKIFAKKD